MTGNRRRDFILQGCGSDGTPSGGLLVNNGGGAHPATFTDGDGRYGAVFALQAVGSTLISDYGAYGYVSSPGG